MTEMEKKTTKTKRPRTTAAKAAEPQVAAVKAVEPKAATAPKRAAKVTQINASHEEIAKLAHRFWLERGRQHGHDAEDWLRAEQQLLGKAS